MTAIAVVALLVAGPLAVGHVSSAGDVAGASALEDLDPTGALEALGNIERHSAGLEELADGMLATLVEQRDLTRSTLEAILRQAELSEALGVSRRGPRRRVHRAGGKELNGAQAGGGAGPVDADVDQRVAGLAGVPAGGVEETGEDGVAGAGVEFLGSLQDLVSRAGWRPAGPGGRPAP